VYVPDKEVNSDGFIEKTNGPVLVMTVSYTKLLKSNCKYTRSLCLSRCFSLHKAHIDKLPTGFVHHSLANLWGDA
jgi:hypothetical protein